MTKDTFFPPRLFIDPGTPEARIEWAAETAERLAVQAQKKVGANTISGDLIDRSTPAWMQGLALRGALDGTLEQTALERGLAGDGDLAKLAHRIGEAHEVEALLGLADEAEAQAIKGAGEEWGEEAEHLCIAANARATRLALETGQPLWLAPYNMPERYTSFTPQLEFLGGQSYAMGQGRARREFNAASHVKALKRARAWYLKMREREIKAAKARSKKAVPPLHVDLLSALLRREKAIYHKDALIAWENGAHDMYGVDGGRWLYLLGVSAPVAARLSVLAHKARLGGRDTPPLGVEALKGQAATLLNIEGWKPEDGGCLWDGGVIAGNIIQVARGSDARFRLRLTPQRLTLRGRGVNIDTLLVPGLEQSDYLAWAAFKAVEAAGKRKKK